LILLGGWLEDEVSKDREVAFKPAIYLGLFRGSKFSKFQDSVYFALSRLFQDTFTLFI
jgi:hypothetical protein